MTDVRIGSKIHRNIEKLSISKLEHLLQLAETEIVNYRTVFRKRPFKNDENDAYLKTLETNRDLVSSVLKKTTT